MWFIGTGQFASLCLEGLVKRGLSFTRIITGNPTRSGRNSKENPSAVELKANGLGLTVTRTGKLSQNEELITALEAENPGVIFVVDFGQIIREPFLSRLCLNIHPSLLPEYRGAAPIQRALLDGKNHTGVTVFRLAAKMDAGEILAQSEIDIAPTDNASDLYLRLSEIGSRIAFDSLRNEPLKFSAQDDSLSTYANKIDKSEFEVSFTDSALRFVNTVRALDMSGGAYAVISGKRVKIWRARIRRDISGECGHVVNAEGNPVIMCSDSGVELQEVQSEGKRKMTGREWSAGLRLKAGDVL